MAESDRLRGRNGEWWRLYCQGWTLEALAERDGKSVSTVSEALQQVRDSIPEDTREAVVAEVRDFYRELRKRAMEIAELLPAPMVAGKDGTPVVDPTTGAFVRDYSGRLTAMKTAADMADRERKMLGLDAAVKVEQVITDQSAADKAAAEAGKRLEALEQDEEGTEGS